MKRKIHVVPHSHWDREWYFTTSRSKVYLMKDLGDVLDTLELMSLYCFCVDIEKPAVSPIRDVKDLYLLSLADTIPADYIISGDKDLLVLGKHNETRILDYNSFLSLL